MNRFKVGDTVKPVGGISLVGTIIEICDKFYVMVKYNKNDLDKFIPQVRAMVL